MLIKLGTSMQDVFSVNIFESESNLYKPVDHLRLGEELPSFGLGQYATAQIP